MGFFDKFELFAKKSDDEREEKDLNIEEIFRFDVSLTEDQEIKIGVSVMELELEGLPEFGEEYSRLAHTFAELIVEHVGMNTEKFIESVSNLPALDVDLTDREKAILAENRRGKSDISEDGSVLFYSFPVLIMEADGKDIGPDREYDGDKQLGVGFERSSKAELMAKVYGTAYLNMEEIYEEKTGDDILNHGLLFAKAVETIQVK